MKIMVLGASGFVGRNVLNALEGSEHDICLSSGRLETNLMNLAATVVYFYKHRPDVIINCAADIGSVHYISSSHADVIHNNLTMTLNIYRAAASSVPSVTIVNPLANCAYPKTKDLQKESEFFDGPVHDSVFSFGNYKRQLYTVSHCYYMQYGVRSINLIAPNSYGPGDSVDPQKTHALNGMVIRMLKANKNNDPSFEIWGSGKPVREWLYVKDFAKLLIQSIDTVKTPEPINLAQNTGYSIAESAKIIADVIGYSGDIVFNSSYKDGAPHKILDDTLFKKVFGDYEFYDHRKGLQETIDYYTNIIE